MRSHGVLATFSPLRYVSFQSRFKGISNIAKDHAAAAIAAAGIPVFAWKGETEEEYEASFVAYLITKPFPNTNVVVPRATTRCFQGRQEPKLDSR